MSLGQLVRNLETDKVIAVPWALHHYGITREEIDGEGLEVVTRHMGLVHGRRAARTVELIISENYSDGTVDSPTLRHLAGVTAMRLSLGASPSHWRNDAQRKLATEQPDGYWNRHNSSNPATWSPIEFDAGSYGGKLIQDKGREFQDTYSGQQIWGSPTRTRVNFIRQQLELTGVAAQVVKVAWWDPLNDADNGR